MNKNLEENINEKLVLNFDNLYKEIELYISRPKIGIEVKNIYNEGISILLKFKIVNSISLFLLDEETFLFELCNVLPDDSSTQHQDYFQNLINNKNFHITLETGQPRMVEEVLIIPLLGNNGIIGLILIKLNVESKIDISNEIKLFHIYSNVFSSIIEKNKLILNLRIQSNSLEQRVALRTKDLNQKQNEIFSIFNAVQTGVFICDKSGILINVNKTASEMVGKSIDDLKGKNINSFLFKINSNNESYLINKFDKEIAVLVNTSTTLLNNEDCIIYSVLDISSRKAIEDALIKLNKDLEDIVRQRTRDLEDTVKKLEFEINERKKIENEIKIRLQKEQELGKLKSKFLQTVSHEFRTPLTIIRSAAQLLDVYGSRLTEEHKNDYIKRIISTVDFMTGLIQNVLFYDNDDHEEVVNQVKINVGNRLIEISKSILENRALNENIIFDLEENLLFFSSPKLFDTIFYNLITNALKYNIDKRDVLVKCNSDEYNIYIEIIDKGIGIPEKDIENIFDLFYRGENIKNIPGIGLGMTVVKDSIVKMKGTIEIDSKENIGTSFKLTFKKN